MPIRVDPDARNTAGNAAGIAARARELGATRSCRHLPLARAPRGAAPARGAARQRDRRDDVAAPDGPGAAAAPRARLPGGRAVSGGALVSPSKTGYSAGPREGVRSQEGLAACGVAAMALVLAEAAGAAVTHFDPYGTTLLDGRKVFPIVLAKGPERDGADANRRRRAERGRRRRRQLPQGRPGHRPWTPEDIDDALAWNREAAERGAYTWINLATLRATPADADRHAAARGHHPARTTLAGAIGDVEGSRRAVVGGRSSRRSSSSPTASPPRAATRAGAPASGRSTPTTSG